MARNPIALAMFCIETRMLAFGAMFALSTLLNAAPEVKPIEVPPEHTQDNLLTRWQKPIYPMSALEQELTGEVTIEFDPDQYGGLTNIEVVESKPTGVFDAAVLKTLNWWTVIPFRAAKCLTNFPRTRITIRFDILKHYPQVIASRPMPLMDPALKPSGTTGDAAKSDLDKLADSTSNKKKPTLRWKKATQPDYPMRNNRLHPIPGYVAAILTVEPDGRVSNTKITLSAPHPAFAEEVESAVKSWLAETLDGEAPGVTKTLCQTFSFGPRN